VRVEPGSAVGIMGGTFDPVHHGHLVAAEAVRARLGLERVVFVPAGRPPHKEDRLVSDERHRYLMTVMATVTNPLFTVSRIEIDRPGPSYTVDTVQAFRDALGPSSPLYFITGFDAVREILTWREPELFLQLCQLVAVTRPGYRVDEVEALRTRLRREGDIADPLHILEVPALAISSSDIRRRVAAGEPIKYLVPESVETYIEKTGLYRPEGGAEAQGVVGD
jgi:nicotinate-nucleotide adenylyltransferase